MPDELVQARYERVFGRFVDEVPMRSKEIVGDASNDLSAKDGALLRDIASFPIAGVTARYARLGWNAKAGNDTKDRLIGKGLATFEDIPTANARVRILILTDRGVERLARDGIAVPSWRRGGAAHEYWKAVIRRELQQARYAVEEEFAIDGGRAVDLHAHKGAHEVFVEIETGKSDIAANIEKCRALSGTVVFFFVTSELRATFVDVLPSATLALVPTDIGRLRHELR